MKINPPVITEKEYSIAVMAQNYLLKNGFETEDGYFHTKMINEHKLEIAIWFGDEIDIFYKDTKMYKYQIATEKDLRDIIEHVTKTI